MSASVWSRAEASPSKKVTVAYFGRGLKDDFENLIKPNFLEYSRGCKHCEILDLTPYAEDNKLNEEALIEKIKNIGPEIDIVYFQWNDRNLEKYSKLIEELNRLKEKGKVVIAFSGAPSDNSASCPLNQTIFSKVDKAIIVGELTDGDILWPAKCYFGPEILTAVRPPKGLRGKGLGPLIFSARMANQFSRRNVDDWFNYLQARKAKSKRIWTELEEFFP